MYMRTFKMQIHCIQTTAQDALESLTISFPHCFNIILNRAVMQYVYKYSYIHTLRAMNTTTLHTVHCTYIFTLLCFCSNTIHKSMVIDLEKRKKSPRSTRTKQNVERFTSNYVTNSVQSSSHHRVIIY